MQNLLSRYFLKILILLVALILLFFSYNNNSLVAANNNWYETFQLDSEQLVLDGLLNGGDRPTLGRFSRPSIDTQYLDAHRLFEEANKEGEFSKYTSQYGLQIQMFSYLKNIGLEKVSQLKSFTALLMALTVLGLTLTIWRDFSCRSALVFYIVFLVSPWVIAFSSNLYWIPFSWFVPLLLTSIFAQKIYVNIKFYYYLLSILFILFMFKFLSGYEYVTTIVLASITPIVYHGLKLKKGYKFTAALCVGIFLVSLISFTASILIHAKSLDSTAESGFQVIKNTAKKRLSSNDVDKLFLEICGIDQACMVNYEVYRASLESNAVTVAAKYFFNDKFLPWVSSVPFSEQEKESLKSVRDRIKNNFSFVPIFNLEMSLLAKLSLYILGIIFSSVFLITLVALCLTVCRTAPNYLLIPLLITFVAPLSWFLVAKGHSYIHYHMNYVLWYLYFIPFSSVVLSEVKWKR